MPTEHNALTPTRKRIARATKFSANKRGRRIQLYVTEDVFKRIEERRGHLSISDFCAQMLMDELYGPDEPR